VSVAVVVMYNTTKCYSSQFTSLSRDMFENNEKTTTYF